MKNLLAKGLSVLEIATILIPSTGNIVQAQPKSGHTLTEQRAREIQRKKFQGNTPPVVFSAGTLNAANDHYFEVDLTRLRLFDVSPTKQ